MTSPIRRRGLVSIALVSMAFVCGPFAQAATTPASKAKPAAVKPAGRPKPGRVLPDSIAISRLEGLHAQALWRHRPDLAEAWGVKPYSLRFTPLDEATLADGSILDDHFSAMGGWIAGTLVRLGDLKLDFLPADEEG